MSAKATIIRVGRAAAVAIVAASAIGLLAGTPAVAETRGSAAAHSDACEVDANWMPYH